MIRLENAEIGMKVFTLNHGVGTLISLRLSDSWRTYAIIELDKGGIVDIPLDLTSRWYRNDQTRRN